MIKNYSKHDQKRREEIFFLKDKVKLKYLTLVNSQTDTTCAIIILCALDLRLLS
jgi:hypothetical protein